MTLTLLMNGAAATATAGSLRWISQYGERDRLEYQIDRSALPPEAATVTLDQDATRLFTGTVEQWDASGVNDLLHQVRVRYTAVDKTQILDRRLVTGRYVTTDGVTWTAGGIVRRIVQDYLVAEGITAGTIQDGPAVEMVVYNYVAASDCVRELADMVGFSWWIDSTGALYFAEGVTQPAPWHITAGTRDVRGIQVRSDRSQLRTRQFVRGGLAMGGERTESFIGRSDKNIYYTRFPIGNVWDDPPALRIRRTVYNEDGSKYTEEYTPTADEVSHQSGGSWVYAQGQNYIRTQDGGNLSTNNKLYITYKSAVPILIASSDSAAVERRRALEGGTGWYESIEVDEALESSDLAQQKAAGFLRKYGKNLRTVSYETWRSGLRAGQMQSIDIPQLGVSGADWLIQEVEGRDLGKGALSFTVTAVSGESVGGWADYFRKLARKRFSIGDTGETLYILRQGTFAFNGQIRGSWVRSGYASTTARLGVGKLGTMQLGQT